MSARSCRVVVVVVIVILVVIVVESPPAAAAAGHGLIDSVAFCLRNRSHERELDRKDTRVHPSTILSEHRSESPEGVRELVGSCHTQLTASEGFL